MVIDAIQGERQVQSAKRAALVVEAADLAIITVRGSDRQSWMNGLLTCDLARLRAGRGRVRAPRRKERYRATSLPMTRAGRTRIRNSPSTCAKGFVRLMRTRAHLADGKKHFRSGRSRSSSGSSPKLRDRARSHAARIGRVVRRKRSGRRRPWLGARLESWRRPVQRQNPTRPEAEGRYRLESPIDVASCP